MEQRGLAKAAVAVSFVKDVIERLDKEAVPAGAKLPVDDNGLDRTWYDRAAEMIDGRF